MFSYRKWRLLLNKKSWDLLRQWVFRPIALTIGISGLFFGTIGLWYFGWKEAVVENVVAAIIGASGILIILYFFARLIAPIHVIQERDAKWKKRVVQLKSRHEQLRNDFEDLKNRYVARVINEMKLSQLYLLRSTGINDIVSVGLWTREAYEEWKKKQDRWENDVFLFVQTNFSPSEAAEFKDIGPYTRVRFNPEILFSGDREEHEGRLNIMAIKLKRIETIYNRYVHLLGDQYSL